MKEVSFFIDKMTCQACSSGIERSLKRKAFCHDIQVHLLSKKAHITYDASQISLEQIFAFIRKMGYEPYLESHLHNRIAPRDSKPKTLANLNSLIESFDAHFLPKKLKLYLSSIISILVLILSWGEMFNIAKLPSMWHFGVLLFLSLVVMHMGRDFYIRGFKALFAKNPNMDSLIAIGTTSAFLYSLQGAFMPHAHLYFDSVCVIITLVLVGKSIEERSKTEALQSASLLLHINQKMVQKVLTESAPSLSQAQIQSLPTQEIKQNDILKILPGEMIMVDGIVIEGNSNIDKAAINGESLPILAKKDDVVLSGSINLDSVLYVCAKKSAADSTLHKILELIQKAQESKAPIASLADKIAGIFVPLVIFLALCAGAFWWGMRDFEFALSIFVATLVISCPCALGLATPMAILHAQAIAHKMGMFFKDSKAFQTLSEITHIVFDKTGTLTQGLEIKTIKNLSSHTEQEVFNLAYTLESTSAHLISSAFASHALAHNATLYPIADSQNIIGKGIKGTIQDCEYVIGNIDILPPHLVNSTHIQDDKVTLFLATNDEILALFSLQDKLKIDAKTTLELFKKHNISSSIISGDNASNTKSIAHLLGITESYANALPEDKMQLLKDKSKQNKILMVGDGMNDAPALAYAHASMAFASSYDIATQSADIINYNENTISIYNAYALAKASIVNIKQNLVFAFCYNIAFIPLAMGVLGGFDIFLHPMFCALAMSLSSLSVVANAARLKKFKLIKSKE